MKKYIVTENQLLKAIRLVLELRINDEHFVEILMADIKQILDFECLEENKKCSSVDLDIMLKACANAVSYRVKDSSKLFVRNDKGKYEKCDWATILEWIGEVHSALFDKESE